MTKYEQGILYQPGEKETNGTRQYVKGNNPKEIDSSQQKKENKTKLKKETLSDDMTENRENKDKQEQPSEKRKKDIKKKISRAKKIKNALRDFKVYCQNVGGLKSKIYSLAVTIDDYEPTLICSVETILQTRDRFKH